ncbi:redoxin domain-containing protein [Pontibacillus litoralis]|uniref:Thioredoxin domain-containing protein n=1 Tax=Pontibacillus litoralis JSM 072002 TaxID=1385512 RepID=A0A0A5HMX9_9BACI|nr:redoxin domain-containing protein [Pontibacillus litoralis]KGX84962.1 hypothetical protein N784_11345 [Pontibacillus litoralis JSM 072002]
MSLKKAVVLIIVGAMFGFLVYDLVGKQEEMAAPSEKENFEVQDEAISNAEIGLQVGDQAPDFQLTTLNGEQVSLSDYKGQKVMLNFWASWCPPCRAEMPDMEKFYQNTDIQILAVDLTQTETSIDSVQQFVSEHELTFPILLDEDSSVAANYQIRPIPTTYMIDSSGTIQHKSLGAMNYERMMQQYESMN